MINKEIAGLPLKAIQVPALRIEAENEGRLYDDWHPAKEKPGVLTMIPYFAWNNRGETEMRVWQRCR